MLDIIALGILLFAGLLLLYGLVAITETPYRLARERNHPQQDAIRAAGWLSLFALHLPWPLLWIWSMAYRDDAGQVPVLTQSFAAETDGDDTTSPRALAEAAATAFEESTLKSRIEFLEKRIKRIEYAIDAAVEEVQHERKVTS